MNITEKIDELLNNYGLVYSPNTGFDISQYLIEKAITKKYSSEDFVFVMDVLFDFRGFIEIKDFATFSRVFGFDQKELLYPEWLFSKSYIRSFVEDKERLEFDLGSYQELFKVIVPLLEMKVPFFDSIQDKYSLIKVFHPDEANRLVRKMMKKRSNEIVQKFNNSEVQKELSSKLFCIIEEEYKEMLRSVEGNEHNGKNR